jgi:hypothetical protein
MNDVDRAAATIRDLAAIHVDVLIDDFGKGAGSISSLRRLPVKGLKIDREFVQRAETSPDDLAIVVTIVELASAIGLELVAEGVETGAQRDVLDRFGCKAAQGFLWAAAMPVTELAMLLRALPQRRLPAGPRAQASAHDEVDDGHGLRLLLRMNSAGASPTTIASALNRAGYVTPSGARWHRRTVEDVVARAVLSQRLTT